MTRHWAGQNSRARTGHDIVTGGNYFYDCQAVRNAAEVLPEFNVPRVRNDPNACQPAWPACLVRSVAEFNTVTCV
jgi:hypothetical protein